MSSYRWVEPILKKGDKPCPDCRGEGRIEDRDNEWALTYYVCSACNGTGKVGGTKEELYKRCPGSRPDPEGSEGMSAPTLERIEELKEHFRGMAPHGFDKPGGCYECKDIFSLLDKEAAQLRPKGIDEAEYYEGGKFYEKDAKAGTQFDMSHKCGCDECRSFGREYHPLTSPGPEDERHDEDLETLEWLIAYLPGVGERYATVVDVRGGGRKEVRAIMKATIKSLRSRLAGVRVTETQVDEIYTNMMQYGDSTYRINMLAGWLESIGVRVGGDDEK